MSIAYYKVHVAMKNKILVVDDNEFMLSLIAHILDNQGYVVETYSQATGLLEHINTYKPNLIIMDAQLPDGDGRDLCSKIKQSNSTNNIRIVMCSGMDDIDECFKQQGPPDGILHKPFDMKQLINLIEVELPLAA